MRYNTERYGCLPMGRCMPLNQVSQSFHVSVMCEGVLVYVCPGLLVSGSYLSYQMFLISSAAVVACDYMSVHLLIQKTLPSSSCIRNSHSQHFEYSATIVHQLCVSMTPDPQWSTADAEVKVPHVQSPKFTHVLLLNPGVGQNIATHALAIASNFFLVPISTILVHSPSFSPNPPPVLTVLVLASFVPCACRMIRSLCSQSQVV